MQINEIKFEHKSINKNEPEARAHTALNRDTEIVKECTQVIKGGTHVSSSKKIHFLIFGGIELC